MDREVNKVYLSRLSLLRAHVRDYYLTETYLISRVTPFTCIGSSRFSASAVELAKAHLCPSQAPLGCRTGRQETTSSLLGKPRVSVECCIASLEPSITLISLSSSLTDDAYAFVVNHLSRLPLSR